MYSGVLGFFSPFLCFYEKSSAANIQIFIINQIKLFSIRNLNEIKKMKKFLSNEKTRPKYLIFGLILSKCGERAGLFCFSIKKLVTNYHRNGRNDVSYNILFNFDSNEFFKKLSQCREKRV